MQDKLRNVLITVGWGIIAATVTLSVLYEGLQRPLTILELALIFVCSLLAGMLIVDAESVIICSLGAVVIAVVLIYIGLTMPVTLGVAQYGPLREMLAETLTTSAVSIIVRVAILNLLIPTLLGAIAGGILGEYLHV
jgi:hypothetical protein